MEIYGKFIEAFGKYEDRKREEECLHEKFDPEAVRAKLLKK